MKNGVEIRPNGVKIEKRNIPIGHHYIVHGSKNGPWTYLSNARKDADELRPAAM